MARITRGAAVLGLLAALATAGCKYDGTGTKMQWAPDMADSPANKAQRSYLDPPVGAVAMDAIFYPKSPEEAEKTLIMPPAIAQADNMEKAKTLFNTFCIPCHGPKGNGIGLLGEFYPRAADLTNQIYWSRRDGFFFYRITFGSAIMPSYGYAISPHERWLIVKYVRHLQAQAGRK